VLNVLIRLQEKIARDRSYRLSLETPPAGPPVPLVERTRFGGNRHGPPVSLATDDERFVVPGPQRSIARGRGSPEAR
jgi:hypothetical protein